MQVNRGEILGVSLWVYTQVIYLRDMSTPPRALKPVAICQNVQLPYKIQCSGGPLQTNCPVAGNPSSQLTSPIPMCTLSLHQPVSQHFADSESLAGYSLQFRSAFHLQLPSSDWFSQCNCYFSVKRQRFHAVTLNSDL